MLCCDERDRLAASHALDELGRSLSFVVIVQGNERRTDAEMTHQSAGVTRILGGNHAAGAQGFDGARTEVAQISDRRRNHVEPSGGTVCHYNRPQDYELK